MEDQFPFSISLVPRSRNPLLYKSTTTRTHRLVILDHEFFPKCPIDEQLVREFYVNLETICNQVTARAFVHGITFDLTYTLIIETLGIPQEDQLGFPYSLGTTPREEILARELHHDRLEVFRVIVSHTNTLTQSHSILLYVIVTRVLIDEAYVIFSAIVGAASGRHTVILSFGSVIRICVGQGV
ncbi:hypothetical protein F0562_012064 [Nyssa sinensis]|uniref:Uncharacterized protein n=1 Tax=Nyssa sinensis TaxID=561372 RepID=A0A5J4ZU32_9ASTE|nr:hypothetical protein F0562_012064 [Nyssa sinensis]